jgi:2-polyprenyl-3-methyl-5-hydroxy-6-metoxy-1,4-benzoquinol methylase
VSSTSAPDQFAKGMTAWGEQDDRVLDRYRLWQLDLIRPFLGRRILEIGAGYGKFATALSREHAYDRYVALEPSPHFWEGLQEGARALPGVEARNGTLESVPDRDFDTVFSIHVMEHIEDDAAFMRHCFERLRPGGHLITLVPALNFLFSELDKKIGHFRRYDKAMTAELARQNGAEIILNRYDNFIGVLGWLWVCKIRGLNYHTDGNKTKMLGYFDFFSRHVLPTVSRLEKKFAPPLGLNLTCVLRKPLLA